MIAMPAIAMCGLLAMLSMIAAAILRRPWQKYVALGCAGIEVAMVVFLVCTSLT